MNIARLGTTITAMIAANAAAQSVSLRVLIPNSSDIRAVSLPALHDGIYAGFGSRTSDFRSVIYAGRLSDPPGTPPTLVLATGETIPNRPDRQFGTLDFPTVWDGVVYFAGGASAASPPDGYYARGLAGGPLTVLSDRFNGLGPWIKGAFAGPTGVAYVNQGVSSGTGSGISFYTYGQQYIPVARYFDPSPDGALYQSTDVSYVAVHGSTVAFNIRCTYIGGSAGQGVYVHNLDTGQTIMVANWTTAIPGDGRLVTSTGSLDTDGEQIVFTVGNGNPYFGGIAAICVANIDGSGLRTIVRNGDPVPGLPGKTFRNVGRSAVDAGLIYFQGLYADGSSERTALFAHVGGVNIPIILHNQEIEGITGITPWMDPRGMSGRDLAVQCEYVTPDQPFLQKFMLVHARVDPPCPADFNSDGFVTGDDFDQYVAAFESGDASADFNGDGFVTGDDFDAFVVAFEGGC